MSKYVEINVRLMAVYGQGGLKAALPNLFRLLSDYGFNLVIAKEPSLYEMVEVLVRIANDPRVPKRAKKPITEKLDEFVKTRDAARELLLSRRLKELDHVLYGLEDLFADLDPQLG
ncbi:MAG: hypothetical protein WAW37_07845 [Syntrophobacteraceae bacterium]